MTLDPNFYSPTFWPGSPFSVTGYTFTLSAKTFDFTNVPGFDLSHVQYILQLGSGRALYKRPDSRPYDLAAVDGVAVPAPPTSGKVLTVKDVSGVSAIDSFLVAYDPPTLG